MVLTRVTAQTKHHAVSGLVGRLADPIEEYVPVIVDLALPDAAHTSRSQDLLEGSEVRVIPPTWHRSADAPALERSRPQSQWAGQCMERSQSQ